MICFRWQAPAYLHDGEPQPISCVANGRSHYEEELHEEAEG